MLSDRADRAASRTRGTLNVAGPLASSIPAVLPRYAGVPRPGITTLHAGAALGTWSPRATARWSIRMAGGGRHDGGTRRHRRGLAGERRPARGEELSLSPQPQDGS